MWSINERLAGREGLTLPQLSGEWLTDLICVHELEQSEPEKEDTGDMEDTLDMIEELYG